jgi:phosphatidylserine/phosphatidylglycerophosphate/cardiolipin synthase-like enzyme
MKKFKSFFLLLYIPFLVFCSEQPHASMCPIYEVCFSPGENCEQRIISVIAQAKKNIYVQAYSFTSNYIAKALIDAEIRGVEVKIILDRSWLKKPEQYRAIQTLYKHHIPIWIDDEPDIAHNKIMVIDQVIVVTGSYNFTIAAARRNTENVLLITNPDLAKQYLDNWETRLKMSELLPDYNNPQDFEIFRKKIMAASLKNY